MKPHLKQKVKSKQETEKLLAFIYYLCTGEMTTDKNARLSICTMWLKIIRSHDTFSHPEIKPQLTELDRSVTHLCKY